MKRILITISFGFLSLITFSQALSSDTIHWIDYRKITWADFKGEPIDIPGMTGQSMMVLLANFHKYSLFLPTQTTVETVFDRRNSWIAEKYKSDKTLRYYQVLFDLYENYARRLKKDFKTTRFGFNPEKIFKEKYNSILTALNDRNKQYLKETKMGTDLEAIEKWSQLIQTELKEFEN